MKLTDVIIGCVYRVSDKYKAGHANAYVVVLDGPLPMQTRGKYGFSVKFLSGIRMGQEDSLPSVSLQAAMGDHADDRVKQLVQMAVDNTKQVLRKQQRTAQLKRIASEYDVRAHVHLNDVNGRATLTLAKDSEHLLPGIMAFIAESSQQ